jgi:hypothetical protein
MGIKIDYETFMEEIFLGEEICNPHFLMEKMDSWNVMLGDPYKFLEIHLY